MTPKAPRVVRPVRQILDLLALSLAPLGRSLSALAVLLLLVLWFWVPSDRCLVRVDLLPWTALCAGVVLALQGGPLGQGAHPQLRLLSSTTGQLALRLSAALAPQLLLKLFDLGAAQANVTRSCRDVTESVTSALLPVGIRSASSEALLMIVIYGAIIGALRLLGREEGRSAWRPPHPNPWLFNGGRALFILSGGAAIALAGYYTPDVDRVALLGVGALASASFGVTGLLWSRRQNAAQRAILRRRERSEAGSGRVRTGLVSWLIGLTLPAFGAAGISLIGPRALESEATVAAGIALYLAAVATVAWPSRRFIGWTLQLHGVAPVGEAAGTSSGDPGADTTPPQGTFVFDPERVQQVGPTIPWFVPTARAHAGYSHLGVEPLWSPTRHRPLEHVLGRASIPEHNDLLLGRQVRIAVYSGDDVAPLTPGDSQERRLAIYTPDPVLVSGAATRWAWAGADDDTRVQEVDPSTQEIALVDGAVIIVGTGLVSQLTEVEFATPLYDGDPPPSDALPQFQDYEAP